MGWPGWSIFGSKPVLVTVTARFGPMVPSVPEVFQAFEEWGAVLRPDGRPGGVSCDLPVKRFVGFGYGRSLTLPCRIEVQHDSLLAAECDATRLRTSKRKLFYLWSIFFVLMSVPHLMRDGWDVWTALFVFLPWPAVEGNFLYDRWRLRERLRKCLVRLSARGAAKQ